MKKIADKFTSVLKSKEFQKFFVIGISSFLLDFGLLNFQLYILKFNIFIFGLVSLPNLISSITAIIVNYFLQRNWAFKSKNKNVLKESLKFFSVHGFNLIVYNAFLFGIIVQMGVSQPITKILVTAVQLFSSFALYKFFVFRKSPVEEVIKEVLEDVQ